jgi:hypothetical protein
MPRASYGDHRELLSLFNKADITASSATVRSVKSSSQTCPLTPAVSASSVRMRKLSFTALPERERDRRREGDGVSEEEGGEEGRSNDQERKENKQFG